MSTKTQRKPVIRSPYVKVPSKLLLIAYWGMKAAAIGVGFFVTLLSLMAAVGAVTDGLAARIAGAFFGALGLPVLIALVLRRRDEATRLVLFTDVFAVSWLGFAFLFAFALGGITGGLFAAESARLSEEGIDPAAAFASLLSNDAAIPGEVVDASVDASDASDAAIEAGPAPGPTILMMAPPRSEEELKNDKPATLAEKFEGARQALVTISGFSRRGPLGGTGFFVDATGTIATSHESVADATELRVTLASGVAFDEVTLLTDDVARDVALLWIDLEHWDAGPDTPRVTPLRLGSASSVPVGERVTEVANPLGLEATLTEGVLVGKRVIEGQPFLQLSFTPSFGDAGAPLLDARGDVVGFVGAPTDASRAANLAVPVEVIRGLLRPSYPDRRRIGAN